jgi:release factor glutamine methyltransferase
VTTSELQRDIEAVLSASGAGIEDARAESEALAEAAARAAADGDLRSRALAMAAERAAGRPLAYITGRAPFLGLELIASPGVLVPRPETEVLAGAAIEALAGAGQGPRVADICCGSGNLACAIATRVAGAHVWACDLTEECAALARRNVQHLGLTGRVEVLKGDLFGPLPRADLEGTLDVVVCNPPYISTGRLGKDRAHLLVAEPREAFDGGPYGLTIHQRVVTEALPFLRPGGWLMFEVGVGQERQVGLLFDRTKAYDKSETRCDARQQTRVVMARKK